VSESPNKSKRSFILKCFIAAVVVLVFLCLATQSFRAKETWPRLQQIDPSLSVLNEPTRLMKLASTHTGTNLATHSEDIDSTVETRHEAVRALLQLQSEKFGIHLKSPSVKGTGIDHICSAPDLSATNVFLRLIATPSKKADIHATECDYWSLENLDFDRDGRLLSRTAYHQP
jgi:hypothetical protein